MAYLVPDNTRVIKTAGKTLTIKEKLIPDGLKAAKDIASYMKKGDFMKPNRKLGDGKGAKGITIHNTEMITTPADTNPAEQYCRATYNGNMGGVVVHFYVYKAEIWQLLREDEQGYHAADGTSRRPSQRQFETIGGNVDTIAVEVIGSEKASEDAAALLAAHLLKTHDLSPLTDVYTHKYFYPSKNCPAYILPHWHVFMTSIDDYYSAAEPAQIKQGDNVEITGCYANAASANSAPYKTALGLKRQVLKIHSGANYPYQVGNSSGTIGFFKAEGLRKII